MTTETGGPAFPHTVEYKGADCGGVVPHGGMTLRDYFATHASEEDIKYWQPMGVEVTKVRELGNGSKQICYAPGIYTREQARYRYADAMLEARKA